MYVVIVEFTIHAGSSAEFLTRMRQQAQDSLSLEKDCLHFDICIDPGRDDFVLLYEIYTDKAAFDAHLDSNHFQEFSADVQNCVSDKKFTCLEKLTDSSVH